MTAVLIRYESGPRATFGKLFVGRAVLDTLELPWRDNARNMSCVLEGTYDAAFMEKAGRFRDVYHVRDVPGRSGILIHPGNVPSQTKGCVLVGLRRGVLAGTAAVLNSRSAMAVLRQETGRCSVRLEIMGGCDV